MLRVLLFESQFNSNKYFFNKLWGKSLGIKLGCELLHPKLGVACH